MLRRVWTLFLLAIGWWRAYDSPKPAQTIHVPGDKEVPKTTWWNHLIVRWFYWHNLASIQVLIPTEEVAKGWHLGYVPFKGVPRVQMRANTSCVIRTRIGREDVVFFALNHEGQEIPLKLLAVADRYDELMNYGEII